MPLTWILQYQLFRYVVLLCSRKCCTKHSVRKDVEDTESSNAHDCIVVPSVLMTNTCQVMMSTWLWHPWWFETCKCRVDGSDVAARSECDLSGFHLPAVIEGASQVLLFNGWYHPMVMVWPLIWSGIIQWLWCGLRYGWYLCNYGHSNVSCLDFN